METMWPMILDMSRDECKRVLRRLELEAYGSLVSALRAQGQLSKEKHKVLQDLAAILNISMERHRAEIRRAVNDEKLATIAEHIAGPNTSTEWAIEGRRLVPLMPRLVPQTAFTPLANNTANITAAENAKLPPPFRTVRQSVAGDESPPCEPSIPEATKTPQKSVSPSVQVKKEEEDEWQRKRRRSSSIDSVSCLSGPSTQPPTKIPAVCHQQPPQQQVQQQQQMSVPMSLQPQTSRTVSFPISMTPLKITLTSASNRAPVTTNTSTTGANTTNMSTPAPQKVIIVQSPATATNPPSILQRSLSVPVVKTVSTTCSSATVSQPRGASLIINNGSTHIASSTASGTNPVSNIVTISTNPANGNNLTPTTVSIGGIPTTAYITSQNGGAKIRPKTVQLSQKPRPRTGSIVIPVTPNQLMGGPGLSGVQLKTALQTPKTTVHIKQDNVNSGGVKLLPMTSIGSTAKILPKPIVSSSNQPPMYVMSTTAPNMSIVTRTVSSSSTPRVKTVNSGSAVSCSLRPVSKPVQGSAVNKPNGGKPNVIVVQKGSGPGFSRGVTLSHSGKEVVGKVIMGKSLSSTLGQSVQKAAAGQPVSSTQGNVIVLDLSQEQLNKNTMLAEILQASGILSEDIGSPSTEKADDMSTDWADVETNEKECVITEMGTVGNDDTEAGGQILLEEEMEIPSDKAGNLEEEELLGEAESHIVSTSSHQLPSQVIDRKIEQLDSSSSGQDMMEVVGELDPQTGIYSIHSSSSAADSGQELLGSSITIVPSSSTSNTEDIFTTALASADINLDTFQYVEDGMDNLELASQNSSNFELTISSDQGKYLGAAVSKVVVESLPKELGALEDQYTSFLESATSSSARTCETSAVTVEPSPMDVTGMHIEDFTSQKIHGQDLT